MNKFVLIFALINVLLFNYSLYKMYEAKKVNDQLNALIINFKNSAAYQFYTEMQNQIKTREKAKANAEAAAKAKT